MHLHRAPRLLLGVGPEQLVGYLFLLVRHYVVKILKGYTISFCTCCACCSAICP